MVALNQDGGGLSDTKQPNVMTKFDPSINNLSKQSLSSLNHNCVDFSNHVEVFLENGVLIIKINILDLLNSFNSNSEDNQSITVKSTSISLNFQNAKTPIAVSVKGTSSATNNKLKSHRDNSKPLNLSLGLYGHVFSHTLLPLMTVQSC